MLGRRGHGSSSFGTVRDRVRFGSSVVVVVVVADRAAIVRVVDVQRGEWRRRRRQLGGDQVLARCWDHSVRSRVTPTGRCWCCWLVDYEGPIPVTDVALWHRVQLVPVNPTGSRPTHSNPRLSPVHSTSLALPPWLCSSRELFSRFASSLSLSSRSSSPFEIISIRNLDDCFALGPSLVPGRMFCNLISLSLFFSPRLETLQRARQSTMLEQFSPPRSVPRSPRRIVLKYDPVRRTTTSSRSNRLQSSCGRYGTYDDKDGRAVTRYFCLLSNSYTHATHG